MQIVGNYRMYHLIRAGSAFEIWAVRPMADNTAFAMKWLPPGPKHTKGMIADLRHEFSIGITLDHPNIIKTYEFDTTKEGTFLIMELFRSPNVKQWLHMGLANLHYRLPYLLTEMATSLAELHNKGWVHRDIKPDNYLMSEEGDIRLIDFGLTRKKQGMLGKLLGGKSKVQGTQSYLSPEQIRGKAVDHRADIYSFGCMVHELITGKPPFTASSTNELLTKHLRTKPPTIALGNKNITPEFATFVQTMLAKDPNDRPQTMEDFSRELKVQKIFYKTPEPPAPEEDAASAAN